jgi:transposase
MTVPPEVEADIRRLFHAEHWKVGTIAAHLNIHHDVVRRVLGILPGSSSSGPRAMLVDPYRDFVAEQLKRYPRLRATRLHDMLKERGFSGSVRTLRKLVAQLRPAPTGEVYLRLPEPLPGEEAQCDWAHVGPLEVPGGKRSLWLFVMILSYSRALWAEFVFQLTADSLRRSLVRAATFFGGCTRQWLFDNPKSVVLERHGQAIRFHPDLLDVASYYHVQPRLCAVGKGNQKGRVERSIRFLRERFLAGRSIDDIESGNRELAAFLADVAFPRPHPVFREKTVAAVFAQEQPRLLPLPDCPAHTDRLLPAQVDKTASVRFDTNTYSVPPRFAQRMLTLVVNDTVIRFLDRGSEVARHQRSWGRHQLIEHPQHRREILDRKPAAQDLKGRDRLKALVPGLDALYTRWLDSGRSLSHMTLKALKLLDLYGEGVFIEAVNEALSRQLHDPGALAQLCEQKRRARQRPVPFDLSFARHVPDADVIPHDLETYDDPSEDGSDRSPEGSGL